jgi:hypothetical protein
MLKPEKRPLPIQLYNALSRFIGINGKLDFDKLLNKAKRNTGLQFLGTDFNEEALQVLIKSINEEAQLHPFGSLMIREKLIGQLENRLWAEHWFKKYPEILGQEVVPIVLVTGLQRTGTTKMQRLLSRQEGARALMSWEALYPAPIKRANENGKRIARTNRNEKAVKFISPAFQAIHPIHTDQPEEDVLLLDVHFMSSSSEAILHVPSYAHWLEEQDHSEAYVYEKKLLLLLQWQRGGKFWVLKSPHHLQYLEVFTRIFPESKIVWMHREIENCIPSYLSMLYYSRNMFKQQVDKNALKSHWLNKLSLMLDGGLSYRESNPGQIIDVKFEDFMKDENKAVSSILSQMIDKSLKFEVTGKKNEKYVTNHRYQLDDWDITYGDLSTKFVSYNKLVKELRIKD